MKITIHAGEKQFGPVNGAFARMFWALGFIPPWTLVSVEKDDSKIAIESCPSMNVFPKTLLEKRDYINGTTLLSQKARCTEAQVEYLQDLGWPFSIEKLNYYQADFLRKEIEKAFPERLRPLIDPENPWSPGLLKPMNVVEQASDEWKKLPPSNRQIKVIRFFGFPVPSNITRGLANIGILRIFENPENRKRWEQYKLLTGDFYDDSPELRPFDPEKLARVRISSEYRAMRREMWEFLNASDAYWAPWLKMNDVEVIVESASIEPLFQSDRETFKQLFLEAVPSYSAEIADRERRHCINS